MYHSTVSLSTVSLSSYRYTHRHLHVIYIIIAGKYVAKWHLH